MGAGTPGCLETREVGNASFSKQPAWNKTLKAKNREAGYGNEIKTLVPLPLWGRARHPNVTNGHSNRWSERLECDPCPHQCVPSSRCLAPHLVLRAGPSPAALAGPSCLQPWGNSLTVRHRCGVTSSGALYGIRPRARHIPFRVQRTLWTGASPGRGGDKRSQASSWDFTAGRGCGVTSAAICFHLPL